MDTLDFCVFFATVAATSAISYKLGQWAEQMRWLLDQDKRFDQITKGW